MLPDPILSESAFKVSAYTAFFDDIRINGKLCSGIYGFRKGRFLPANEMVKSKLRRQHVAEIDVETLKDLIGNEMLVPSELDEHQYVEDLLLLMN